ncbi:MAG: hypothetical protein P1V97_21440 [Planctomycetota bacterium]|nr:hypothetical protein [Planctomycetota bacterium]
MIRFQCHQCAEFILVPDQFAGQPGRCKHCQAAITVPFPNHDAVSLWAKIHEGPRALRFGLVGVTWLVVILAMLALGPGSPLPVAKSQLRKQWAVWKATATAQPSYVSTSDITELEVLDEFIENSTAIVWIRTAHEDGTRRNHRVSLRYVGNRWKYEGILWFDQIQRIRGGPSYFPDEGSGDFEVLGSKQRYAWKALMSDPRSHSRDLALRDLSDKPELFTEFCGSIVPLLKDPDPFVKRKATRLILRAKNLPPSCVELLKVELKNPGSQFWRSQLLAKLLSPAVDPALRKDICLEAIRDKALRPLIFNHLAKVGKLPESVYFQLLEASLTLGENRLSYTVQTMLKENIPKKKIKGFLMGEFLETSVGSQIQVLRHLPSLGPLNADDVRKLFVCAERSPNSSVQHSIHSIFGQKALKHRALLLQLCCGLLSKPRMSKFGEKLVAALLNRRKDKLPHFSNEQIIVAFKQIENRQDTLRMSILYHSQGGKRSDEHLIKALSLVSVTDYRSNQVVVDLLNSQAPLSDTVLNAYFTKAYVHPEFARLSNRILPRFGKISRVKPFIEKGLTNRKTALASLDFIWPYGKEGRLLLPQLKQAFETHSDYNLKASIKRLIDKLTAG